MYGADRQTNAELVEKTYVKYKKLMFLTAGKYTANISDQEDIVQTALERLLKVFGKQETSKHQISASYIVYTIRSVSIDFLRKQGPDSGHLVSTEDEQIENMAKTDDTLEDLISSLDCSARLTALWSKIPVDDRFLLEGKYIFGFTDKELAIILKCKPSGIRMKLTRARRQAAKFLLEGDST